MAQEALETVTAGTTGAEDMAATLADGQRLRIRLQREVLDY
jgi:hypothetical protein